MMQLGVAVFLLFVGVAGGSFVLLASLGVPVHEGGVGFTKDDLSHIGIWMACGSVLPPMLVLGFAHARHLGRCLAAFSLCSGLVMTAVWWILHRMASSPRPGEVTWTLGFAVLLCSLSNGSCSGILMSMIASATNRDALRLRSLGTFGFSVGLLICSSLLRASPYPAGILPCIGAMFLLSSFAWCVLGQTVPPVHQEHEHEARPAGRLATHLQLIAVAALSGMAIRPSEILVVPYLDSLQLRLAWSAILTGYLLLEIALLALARQDRPRRHITSTGMATTLMYVLLVAGALTNAYVAALGALLLGFNALGQAATQIEAKRNARDTRWEHAFPAIVTAAGASGGVVGSLATRALTGEFASWNAIFAGAAVLAFLAFCTQQLLLQRYFAPR